MGIRGRTERSTHARLDNLGQHSAEFVVFLALADGEDDRVESAPQFVFALA
jgi:hypothetical protein